MELSHPLLTDAVRGAVERAATAHRGANWACTGFTDLSDRAAHPSGIFHGSPFAVFAKLGTTVDAAAQFTAELAGLRLLHDRAGVAAPVPVAGGVIGVPAGTLLLSEALPERPPEARTAADWRSIGRALATLHGTGGPEFGLAGTAGYFGPLPQDNRPVRPDRWAVFYAERRLAPNLRLATDSGHLPPRLAAGVAQIIRRLPALAGPEPHPTLLHGDAQQHNFISTPAGAVLVDPAPYFGHPEIDLALLGYFHPVPRDVFDGYTEIRPIDDGFPERRELWRVFAYLAVVTVGGTAPLGRAFLSRLDQAIDRYVTRR